MTIALQRILRHVEVADIRVDPAKICVARSAEFAKFDTPPAAVVNALKRDDVRIFPASECTTRQQEWGRVNWYVNTMRAQRFVFIFRRAGGEWKLDDGSKLGIV